MRLYANLGNPCHKGAMTLSAPTLINLIGLLVFGGFMIWAAVGDVRSFTITNKLNTAIATAFLLLALPMGMAVPEIFSHIKVGLITIIISLALFYVGVYGGGDAKMTGAVALWLGPAPMMPFIFVTAIAGGLLVFILIISRRLAMRFGLPQSPKWARRMLRKRSGVPYGVALGIGAIVSAPLAAWFPTGIF
jgi:prepilin peptidase CpaA